MLSLTRKPGEAILIGDNVVVYIKEIKGKQVKLAIEARATSQFRERRKTMNESIV